MRIIDADDLKKGISEKTKTSSEASRFIDIIDQQKTFDLWNKVNLRKKNPRLPEENKVVCWATLNKDGKTFRKFFAKLQDGYIDGGTFRYKLSSNFWWAEIQNPVE